MPGRLLTVAFALAALAAAVASCGGGGDGERSEEQEIRAMLRESSELDPSNCTRFQTLAFTEQLTKEAGDAAIRACEETVRDESPEDELSTEVTRLRANDGSATLRVSFEGRMYDGQELEFALVERDGHWKFDEMVRFVEFNRAKFIAELGVGLIEEASSAQELELYGCVIEGLEGMSGEELERLLLGPSWDPLYGITETCAVAEPPAQPA